MKSDIEVTDEEINNLYEKLKKEAEGSGYFLNPDVELTKEFVRGLLINEKRYGYWVCPCRLPSGNREDDLDIICPCDYRDPDLAAYETCYCSLYVSQAVAREKRSVGPIPERRPLEGDRKKTSGSGFSTDSELSQPVWRCKVCGYLCAREGPPELCPICKAKKERFERFI